MIKLYVEKEKTEITLKGTKEELLAEIAQGIAVFLRDISNESKKDFEVCKDVLLCCIHNDVTYKACMEDMKRNEQGRD